MRLPLVLLRLVHAPDTLSLMPRPEAVYGGETWSKRRRRLHTMIAIVGCQSALPFSNLAAEPSESLAAPHAHAAALSLYQDSTVLGVGAISE
jgi:hypothetical protein